MICSSLAGVERPCAVSAVGLVERHRDQESEDEQVKSQSGTTTKSEPDGKCALD